MHSSNGAQQQIDKRQVPKSKIAHINSGSSATNCFQKKKHNIKCWSNCELYVFNRVWLILLNTYYRRVLSTLLGRNIFNMGVVLTYMLVRTSLELRSVC